MLVSVVRICHSRLFDCLTSELLYSVLINFNIRIISGHYLYSGHYLLSTNFTLKLKQILKTFKENDLSALCFKFLNDCLLGSLSSSI